jgi:hypothetical protein
MYSKQNKQVIVPPVSTKSRGGASEMNVQVISAPKFGSNIRKELCLLFPTFCAFFTSGKLHLSFLTLSHLNDFWLRHDKIKYFIITFSVLFCSFDAEKFQKKLCFM